jgi:Cu2+-exporting ATPase
MSRDLPCREVAAAIGPHMPAQWSEPVNPKTASVNMPRKGSVENSVMETPQDSTLISANTQCLHCQRLCKGSFCCAGCEQVFRYIKSAGLSRYYSIRKEFDTILPISINESSGAENPSNMATFSADPFVWKESSESVTFAAYVPTLSCAACLWLIRAALVKIPAVTGVDVNFEDKLIFVKARCLDGENQGAAREKRLREILQTLMQIGYKSYPPGTEAKDSTRNANWRKTITDLAISGAIFGNVMLFAAAVYLGRDSGDLTYLDGATTAWAIEGPFRLFFDITSAVLTTLSLVLVGKRFFLNAWKALRLGTIHIDQPIALALALTYLVSMRNLIVGSPLLYFDSIAGLIFFLLMARATSEILTERAKRLAGAAIASIPESNIKSGETYEVAPGDIVLTDGIVVEGTGEVSEVALTGETMPVLKCVGDRVLAGSQNLISGIKILATTGAGDSYVQRIRRIIAEATHNKPLLTPTMDLVLRWFIIGIFIVTALALLIWSQRDSARMIEVVCAVLIVSCPCSLALAVPLARSFALKRAWRSGVIVKTPEALEICGKIDTLVLDKTGTLTTGIVSITQIVQGDLSDFRQHELQAVYLLAKRSRHPVSAALARYLVARMESTSLESDVFELTNIVETPGLGVAAQIIYAGEVFTIKIGRSVFIDAALPKAFCPGFSVAGADQAENDGKKLFFKTADPLRLDSAPTVRKWQQRGIDVHILSGDLTANVSSVAKEIGVKIWCGEKLPEEKQAYVNDLVRAGRIVAMVGDGINDACAIGAAHVGIAVKGGADLALTSADIFLSQEGLAIVDETLTYAHYTQTTQKVVMIFGIAYNVIAVSLALSGVLHPLAAALIMPLSSVSVIAVAYFRKGSAIWKSSTSSCLLPSPSLA